MTSWFSCGPWQKRPARPVCGVEFGVGGPRADRRTAAPDEAVAERATSSFRRPPPARPLVAVAAEVRSTDMPEASIGGGDPAQDDRAVGGRRGQPARGPTPTCAFEPPFSASRSPARADAWCGSSAGVGGGKTMRTAVSGPVAIRVAARFVLLRPGTSNAAARSYQKARAQHYWNTPRASAVLCRSNVAVARPPPVCDQSPPCRKRETAVRTASTARVPVIQVARAAVYPVLTTAHRDVGGAHFLPKRPLPSQAHSIQRVITASGRSAHG